jgi:hypothetical protein
VFFGLARCSRLLPLTAHQEHRPGNGICCLEGCCSVTEEVLRPCGLVLALFPLARGCPLAGVERTCVRMCPCLHVPESLLGNPS